MSNEALFIGHEPCPKCGSTDNLARYTDGHGWCFGCQTYFNADGTFIEQEAQEGWTPIHGEYRDLPKRGLDEEDLHRWGYQVGEHPTLGPVHVMNIRDQAGKLIAQKYRTHDKDFVWTGKAKDPPLYGVWLWPSKGKWVVVTEGELDAISVSKAFSHRWPVVSLPNGTGSLRKTLKSWYTWLDGYDKIVLWFDADEAGQKALEEAVGILPPGKVYIARSPEGCKDANDTLREHGTSAVSKAFWDAAQWRPDGIVDGRSFTRQTVKLAVPAGIVFPYPKLQQMTLGLREQELTLLTAGSGIGKSTLAREWAYYLVREHGRKVGNIFLEEPNTKTVQAYIAIHNNVPLGALRANPDLLPDDAWDRALAECVWDRMWFYDHFGSLAADSLISKIAYLRRVCGVNFVILDHISIVTSGMESSSEGERKDIDILMTRLAQVIQQTGVGIVAIVHLKRKPNVSFNEGAPVSLSDLRGSASLEQLADNVYAMERDQQAPGEKSTLNKLRVVKCRETGWTGLADTLKYDRNTGRLGLQSHFNPAQLVNLPLPLNEAGLKVLEGIEAMHTF